MTGEYHPDPLISDAILAARYSHPWYSRAIDALRIVADPRVATMSTSAAWITHYNPATVAGWTPDERAAVLVHEVEHLLRRHHDRCGDRDPKRWNLAGDAEINQRLAGLPKGAIYPATLGLPNGATAETYYGASTPPEPPADPDPSEGDPGESGETGDGDGAGSEPGDGPGKGGAGQGDPGDGDGGLSPCGSAAGGPTQPHETADAADPGDGAADPDAIRRDVAQQVMAGVGSEAGDELRAWAESELGIDRAAWYSALATIVGRTLAPYGAPTRWRWPGRRDLRDMGGAMVPRWTGERPSAAVILDTSGSITPADLDLARSAGHYLGRIADVTYYGCDTVPTSYGAILPDVIRGGGGTDMRNGIDRAIADGARCVIVITDCETAWPAEPTAVPLIIGVNVAGERYASGEAEREYTANGGRCPEWAHVPPDWATVVRVVAS